jgi:hypothetical protein
MGKNVSSLNKTASIYPFVKMRLIESATHGGEEYF